MAPKSGEESSYRMTNLAKTSVRLVPVQEQGLVLVVGARDNENSDLPVGSATLVGLNIAIMPVGHRDPTPTLPLHVLVPVAAGGDRDEQTPDRDSTSAVEVLRVHPAADGSDHLVLELDSQALADLGLSPVTQDDDGQKGGIRTPWYCKIWPPLCR